MTTETTIPISESPAGSPGDGVSSLLLFPDLSLFPSREVDTSLFSQRHLVAASSLQRTASGRLLRNAPRLGQVRRRRNRGRRPQVFDDSLRPFQNRSPFTTPTFVPGLYRLRSRVRRPTPRCSVGVAFAVSKPVRNAEKTTTKGTSSPSFLPAFVSHSRHWVSSTVSLGFRYRLSQILRLGSPRRGSP